jgi:hypothetical protein
VSRRAEALAQRLEQGAAALAKFAETMTDAEWGTKVPPDGRTAGVIVHHVADVYPLEVQLAQQLASGKPIAGVTWADVAKMNAGHADQNAKVSKQEALEHLRKNSKEAAKAIRALSDDQLDTAATVSLNFDAPLTCQFFVEDHPVRHSYHHLGRIRAALKR